MPTWKNSTSGRKTTLHLVLCCRSYESTAEARGRYRKLLFNARAESITDLNFGLKGPAGDQYFYPRTQFDVQGAYRPYKGVQFEVSGLNLSNEVSGFYKRQREISREEGILPADSLIRIAGIRLGAVGSEFH